MAEVGPDVGDLRATAFEVKCDHGLQRVTDVGLFGAIEDQIDHPAALGICVDPNRADQESILEIAKYACSVSLATGILCERRSFENLLTLKVPPSITHQLPRHPSQRHRVGHRVAFDHIPQQHCVNIATQQIESVARRGALSFGKSTGRQVNTKFPFRQRSALLYLAGAEADPVPSVHAVKIHGS
jgi:hypothetical protein